MKLILNYPQLSEGCFVFSWLGFKPQVAVKFMLVKGMLFVTFMGLSTRFYYFIQRFCLFVLLLYIPSQQLWSWLDGQFT